VVRVEDPVRLPKQAMQARTTGWPRATRNPPADFGVAMAAEGGAQPAQEAHALAIGEMCVRIDSGFDGIGAAAVEGPRFLRYVRSRCRESFREKHLILVHVGEVRVEAVDALPECPADESVRRRWWGGVSKNRCEQEARRFVVTVERGGLMNPVVTTFPTTPVASASEDEFCCRVRLREGELAFELFGEPDVIGVEQRDPLAERVVDPQIARRTYATI